jgi:hypothetical protein
MLIPASVADARRDEFARVEDVLFHERPGGLGVAVAERGDQRGMVAQGEVDPSGDVGEVEARHVLAGDPGQPVQAARFRREVDPPVELVAELLDLLRVGGLADPRLDLGLDRCELGGERLGVVARRPARRASRRRRRAR